MQISSNPAFSTLKRLNLIRIRSAFFLVGFIGRLSLVAQTPREHTHSPQTAARQGETGAVLHVVDRNNATVANAHVVIRDENGRAIVDTNTNQEGLLRLPAAAGTFVFSVSSQGFEDFHSSFFVSPDRVTQVEIGLKDSCRTTGVNCDEFTGTPPVVDAIQPDSAVVIAPYPITPEPVPRRPGFFKRLFAPFRRRHN